MQINKNIIIAFLLGCFLANMSEAASFDCGKAKTSLEKTICADPNLSNLDEVLAKDYDNSMQILSVDGKKILRDSQRRWLRFINDSCFKYKNDRGSTVCMQEMYKTRIKDMKTAAVKIGPFLFSRVDYYFSKSDDQFGRPYEGQTSYPRIDNPLSNSLTKWNTIMAPKPEAGGEDLCDGRPGDRHIGFEIKSATNIAINTKQSYFFYCHGTAHGYANIDSVTYILTPEPHILKADDVFSQDSPWRKFLIDRFYDARPDLIEMINKDRLSDGLEETLTDPRAWSFTKESLVINANTNSLFGGAGSEMPVVIPWNDLQPFLLPNAPISIDHHSAD